jgi:ABC-type transport system involved in cytochrome c biogenesis permease subunit
VAAVTGPPAGFASVFGVGALVFYVLAAGLYILNLYRPSPAAGRAATAAAALGALLNFASLYARAVALGTVPYRDLMGSMKLFGFFLAALNVVLELRHKDRSLGPFLMPAALVFMLVALLETPAPKAASPQFRGSVFALHVTLNMFSYAAFAVACALSLLYLSVGRALKHRGKALAGHTSRLPTLGYLERATRTSLAVGVLTLLTGLSCGFVWASRVWGAQHLRWGLDPKIWVAVATLLFYLAILVRARRGAAPVTTARLCVAGFVLILISYTAVNLLVTRLHSFT